MVSAYDPRDVEVLGPGRVLLGGRALLDLVAMLEHAMTSPNAAGVLPGVRHAWPALLQEARAVQMAQAAEQRLLAEPPAPTETMSVPDAADVLGVHERQVRRRAEAGRYGARKWRGAWVLDRVLVHAEAPSSMSGTGRPMTSDARPSAPAAAS